MVNSKIRRVNDLGYVVIPKEIRRNLGIKENDLVEFSTTNEGAITIRKYKKSFEQCAIDWYTSHQYEMNHCRFHVDQQYTFCIVCFPYSPTRGGYAKRYEKDEWDSRIGCVAAYARAMGRNLNKMIGYEG